MRMGWLIIFLALGPAVVGQEPKPTAGTSDWIESNYAGKPPAHLMRSKNGHLELVSILGSKRFRHSGGIGGFCFNKDGTRILSVGNQSYKVWETSTGKQIATWRGRFSTNAFAYSQDGKLALAGGFADLEAWDAETGKPLVTLLNHFAPTPQMPKEDLGDYVWVVGFSLDGKTALSASATGSVSTWDLKTARNLSTWRFKGEGAPLAFTVDGKAILSVEREPAPKAAPPNRGFDLKEPKKSTNLSECVGTLTLRTVKTGVPFPGFQGATLNGETVAVSPDGTRIFVCKGSLVRILDLASGKEVATFEGPSPDQFVGLISPTGSYSVWSDGKKNVLFNSVTREKSSLGDSDWRGRGGQFSPDGRQFAQVAAGGFRLWDVAEGRELVVDDRRGPGYPAAVCSDGRRLVSANCNLEVSAWDLRTGKVLSSSRKNDATPRQSGHNEGIALSPGGKLALAALEDGLLVWDVELGGTLVTLKSGPADFVTLSQDGQRALSAEYAGGSVILKTWDIEKLQPIASWNSRPSDYFQSIALSPNGQLAVIGSGWVKGAKSNDLTPTSSGVWDATTGKLLVELKDPSPAAPAGGRSPDIDLMSLNTCASSFSPNGKYALIEGPSSIEEMTTGKLISGENHLWEVATGKLVARWKWDRYERCLARAFSTDGKRALLGGTRTLVLVDVASGREVDSIPVDGDLFSLSVDQQRALVLVGCRDGTLSVYRIKD